MPNGKTYAIIKQYWSSFVLRPLKDRKKGCYPVQQEAKPKKKRDMPTFYRFVSLYQDYMNMTRDYGDGVQHSMVEMHILAIVCQEPGITVGQVAQQWGRTKGAASQNVTKLEKRGLLVRAKLPHNAREVHLYPTKHGQHLAQLHAEYDQRTEARIARELLARCSMEELELFDRILNVYSDVLEQELNVRD